MRNLDDATHPRIEGSGGFLKINFFALSFLYICAACLIYYPSLRGEFLFDDLPLIVHNPYIQNNWGLFFIWFEVGALEQYYPLTFFSFWIDRLLWGENTFGYHIENVILHALNSIALFALVKKILGRYVALVASILFLVHPVQVETVAWISERKNLLCMFISILAVYSYLRIDGSRTLKARVNWYMASLLLFVFALLSKSIACMVVPVIILLEWYLGTSRLKKVCIYMIPFAITGMLLGLLTVVLERGVGGASGIEWQYSFLDRISVAAHAIFFYISKLLYPADLSFIYPKWEPSELRLSAIALIPCQLFFIVILYLKRRAWGKGFIVASFMYLALLFPALGFFNIATMRYTFVADHYQYMASAVFFVVIAYSGAALTNRAPRALCAVGWILILTIILSLAICANKKSRHYRSPEALYKDAITKNPDCWSCYHNLGVLKDQEGSFAEAQRLFELALSINPNSYEAHHNLATVLFNQKEYSDAAYHLDEAVKIKPDYIVARYHLGLAYEKLGRLNDAKHEYAEVLRQMPNHPGAEVRMNKIVKEKV